MKRNDLVEIKSLDTKALQLRVSDLKKEIDDLIIDKNMNKLNDLKAISKKRRDVAQISTIINQKLALEKLEKNLEDMKKATEGVSK